LQQDKEKIRKELAKIKSMHVYFEEKYQQLASKYELTMKDKMTLKIEKERLLLKTQTLQKNTANLQDQLSKAIKESTKKINQGSAFEHSTILNTSQKENSSQNLKSSDKQKSKKNPLLTKIPENIDNPYWDYDKNKEIEFKSTFPNNFNQIKNFVV
jgi:hypothetical protein